jgi:hypothetical protein
MREISVQYEFDCLPSENGIHSKATCAGSIPFFDSVEAPVAYCYFEPATTSANWQAGDLVSWCTGRRETIVRVVGSTLYSLAAKDEFADARVIERRLRSALRFQKVMQPIDSRYEIRAEIGKLAIIDGQLWRKCGEPTYSVWPFKSVSSHETQIFASVMFEHSVGLKHENTQTRHTFAADGYQYAVEYIADLESRGFEMSDQLLDLHPVIVTGAHRPGSTWFESGIENLPDPQDLTFEELGDVLTKLRSSLSLARACPFGTHIALFNPDVLSFIQVDVTLGYLNRAESAGIDLAGYTEYPTPPSRRSKL